MITDGQYRTFITSRIDIAFDRAIDPQATTEADVTLDVGMPTYQGINAVGGFFLCFVFFVHELPQDAGEGETSHLKVRSVRVLSDCLSITRRLSGCSFSANFSVPSSTCTWRMLSFFVSTSRDCVLSSAARFSVMSTSPLIAFVIRLPWVSTMRYMKVEGSSSMG